MSNKDLRIIFMGTPEFAVPSLKKLVHAGYQVAGVITSPDKPAGRGRKMRMSDVKKAAIELGLRVLQPAKLRDPEFIRSVKELRPDIQVVVAFRMLPESVWSIPAMGTFNLHASLLPQYRGAAPINHVLINGETETGVTTFLIDQQIDTGNILMRAGTEIGESETAGELHDRLMEMGADLVLKTVSGLADRSLHPVSQEQFVGDHEILKQAPKIFRDNCLIHWDRQGKEVVNLIRGLSPYPGAYTHLSKTEGGTLECKVFRASFLPETVQRTPGTIITDKKSYLKVAVQDGFVAVHSLQAEGKKTMDVRTFLNGFKWNAFQLRFF